MIFPGFLNRKIAWVLKLFYKLLYHQFASYYDLISGIVSSGQWNDWVKTAHQFLAGSLVLEIGHGPGHLLRDLNISGIQAIGIEESRQMNSIARNRLSKENFPVYLVNGMAQALPFCGSSFHQVASTFPGEYILSDDTLLGIHRVLKPGGALIIIPAVWITGSKWNHKIVAWLFKVTLQSPGDDINYVKNWSRILRKASFRVEAVYHILESSKVLVIIARKPQ